MKRFVLLLFVLVAISCQEESAYRHAVREAEELLSEQPDSSLSLLLPYQSFHSCRPRSRAEFARVFSMVLDNNYIDVNDDSLALVAWNYYKKRPLSRERMLSAYSLGRVQYNKSDYVSSILSFRKSLKDARSLGDRHYEGLSLSNIGTIYDETYDSNHGLEYKQEAYEAFMDAGEDKYALYQKFSMAVIYMNMIDLHSCDSLLTELKREQELDDNLIYNIDKVYMDMCYAKIPPDPFEVIQYYRKAQQYPQAVFSSKEYSTVGAAYGLLNQLDSMEYYWNKAVSMSDAREDQISNIFDQYVVNKYDGEYAAALTFLEKTVSFQDSLFNEKMRLSISHSLEEFFEVDADNEALEKQNVLYLLLITTTLLSIVIIFSLIEYRRRRYRIEKLMAEVADVEEELQRLRSTQSGLAESVNEMIQDKVRNMLTLSEIYFRFDKKHARKKYATREEVIDSFKKDLKEFRSNTDYLVALENTLNVQKSNMMYKLRQGFAAKENKGERLMEEDWTILIMILSGFSVKAISFFVGLPEATVGMRKNRYAEKIANLDIPEAKDFASEYAKCFRGRRC